MGQRRFVAERCGDCGLHAPLCVCAERPGPLELETAILVIQNNKERNKPTNTARMLPQEGREPGVVEVGCSMWRTCHRFGYLPPTRSRSGPVRFEPHWNGRS